VDGSRYRPWAELLKRTFGIDVETCPRCGGRMRLLAVITDLASAARFLRHQGEPTEPPRQDLPLTALCCVEAGLSAAQARQVWQFEVSPAVGFNLLSVAGEWAYWDEDWSSAFSVCASAAGTVLACGADFAHPCRR
jgi:hypothetical protein